MPPKKDKLTKEELRKLVEQYNIVLEGPAPPKAWPIRFNNHFQTIRDISAIKYDDYVRRQDLSWRIMRKQKERVRDLRTKAGRLRRENKVNEDTWRDAIEKPIMERFQQNVIW